MEMEQIVNLLTTVTNQRLEQLHQWGRWKEDNNEYPNSLPIGEIEKRIKECFYALKEQWEFYLYSWGQAHPTDPATDDRLNKLDREYNVYGFLVPVDKEANRVKNMSLQIQSGKDDILEGGAQPEGWGGKGYCAERKWLKKIQTRKVGIVEQKPKHPGKYGPDRDKSILQEFEATLLGGPPHAWVLYTTLSPCQYCAETIVECLDQGVFNHIVVAFEGWYAKCNEQGSSLPETMPGNAFFRARNEGKIEIFKVHRHEPDRKMLPWEPIHGEDPTVKILRVTKTEEA